MAHRTIALSEIFTTEQGKDLVELYLKNAARPAKAFLEYIKSKPEVLAKCEAQEIEPAYLSYYLEYAFTSSRLGFPSAE